MYSIMYPTIVLVPQQQPSECKLVLPPALILDTVPILTFAEALKIAEIIRFLFQTDV